MTGQTKMTAAQRACLERLAQQNPEPFGGWCGYGTACGVKRNVVRGLQRRGLADLIDTERHHVMARITPAGRAALQGEGRG